MKTALALSVLGMAAVSSTAWADTAGGATIHNAATLTFAGGQATDVVNVQVNTVASQPAVLTVPANITVNSGAQASMTYQIAATSNGSDTYSVASVITESANLTNEQLVVVAANGVAVPVGGLQLGASVTSLASGNGEIYLPAGSTTSLVVNDTVRVGNDLYTITAVTAGTVAATNLVSGVTTAETPASLTLTPVGASPAITAGSVAAGVQVGESVSLQVTFLAGNPTAGVAEQHTVSFTMVTTATNLAGSTLTLNTATSTVTVNPVMATMTKDACSYAPPAVDCSSYSTTPQAKKGEIVKYRLRGSVTPGNPAVTGANVVDELPLQYVDYQVGTTELNGAAVADNGAGTAYPLDGTGLQVNSSTGAAGEIKPGETATVTFKVLVK